MNQKQTNSLMWESILDVQRILELSDTPLADLLKLPSNQLEGLKSQRKPLSVHSVMAIADELNVGFENLMTGKLDLAYVRQKYNLAPPELPERYQVAAFSKRITSQFFLDYVVAKHGPVHKRSILRTLHVDEQLLQNHLGEINILFPSDLVGYLRKHKLLNDKQLPEMGLMAAATYEKIGIAEEIRKIASTPKHVYEIFTDSFINKNLERNHEYRITAADSQQCTMTVRYSNEIQEHLSTQFTNEPLCLVLLGCAASLPRIVGFPNASYLKTKCTLQGDAFCEFILKYDQHRKHIHFH